MNKRDDTFWDEFSDFCMEEGIVPKVDSTEYRAWAAAWALQEEAHVAPLRLGLGDREFASDEARYGETCQDS